MKNSAACRGHSLSTCNEFTKRGTDRKREMGEVVSNKPPALIHTHTHTREPLLINFTDLIPSTVPSLPLSDNHHSLGFSVSCFMCLFFLQSLGGFLPLLLRCQLFVAGDDEVNSLALFQHTNCHIKQLCRCWRCSARSCIGKASLKWANVFLGGFFSLKVVLELSREMFHSVRRGHC